MPDIELFVGPRSQTKEIGFPSDHDPNIPDSYTFQVDATPERPLALKLQITAVTLRQPDVKILANPALNGAGVYQCKFAASSKLVEISGDACRPESADYGKLFHGLGWTMHQGYFTLGMKEPVTGLEDLNTASTVRLSATYAPAAGTNKVVDGVLIMNPGWKYFRAGALARLNRNLYPRLMKFPLDDDRALPGNRVLLLETTIIEVRNTFSQGIPTPHGDWEFTHYSSMDELPNLDEFRQRKDGLHVGDDINNGLSLCHTGLSVPQNPQYELVQYESKFRLFIEVSRPQ